MKYFLLLQRSQRSSGSFKPLRCCTELFQNYFLPFNISEWNKLNPDVRNLNTSSLFLKNLLALKGLLRIVFIAFMIHLVSNFFTDYD